MIPTPVFSTDKITLRPFTPDDAPALHAYLSHPEMTGRRYIPWKFDEVLPLPLKVVEEIIKSWAEQESGFTYALVAKGDQAMVGHATVDWGWDPHMPECVVAIDPEYRRQGYGTQAVTLLLNYLFDFTVAHNVSNWVGEWNQAGRAFAENLGFKNVGQLRRQSYMQGRFYDEVIFDILKPEWKERTHAS